MSLLPEALKRPAAALLFAAAMAVAPASAAVPPDIDARIQSAAATWRAEVAQQQAMLKISGDPHMAEVANSMNREVSGSLIAQAVMDAVARNPADAPDVTAAAMRAAPELRTEILSSLTVAFPGLAQTFAAPPPVQSVAVAQPPRTLPARPAANASEADQVAEEFSDPLAGRDPLEGFNRVMFTINDFLDTWVMVPIATAYRFIMPETLRGMGRSFFKNLNEPIVAINDLLQGDIGDAGTSLGRFAVNSTVGILGFFEVAERVDLKPHNADFGQTLHSYGAGAGAYVVLPFFGPSTLRDTVGTIGDSFLSPFTYILDWETRLYLGGSKIVVEREEVLDDVADLKKGSLDYYAAMRSAWFQRREVELNKGVPPPLGRKTN